MMKTADCDPFYLGSGTDNDTVNSACWLIGGMVRQLVQVAAMMRNWQSKGSITQALVIAVRYQWAILSGRCFKEYINLQHSESLRMIAADDILKSVNEKKPWRSKVKVLYDYGLLYNRRGRMVPTNNLAKIVLLEAHAELKGKHGPLSSIRLHDAKRIAFKQQILDRITATDVVLEAKPINVINASTGAPLKVSLSAVYKIPFDSNEHNDTSNVFSCGSRYLFAPLDPGFHCDGIIVPAYHSADPIIIVETYATHPCEWDGNKYVKLAKMRRILLERFPGKDVVIMLCYPDLPFCKDSTALPASSVTLQAAIEAKAGKQVDGAPVCDGMYTLDAEQMNKLGVCL